MTTVHRGDGRDFAYTKGAPDVVLGRCTKIRINGSILPLGEAKRRKIQNVLEEMSSQALRVLAIAMKTDGTKEELLQEENLIFLGLVGMKDPIRPEAKDAVAKFKKHRCRR